MGHSGDPNEFFEILGNELRAVVGNDPWSGSRVFLFGALKDDFNIWFGHLLSDLPVDNGTAATIQEAAQIIESATDVEIRNINVPVVMRQQRLNESGAFERRLLIPFVEHAGF